MRVNERTSGAARSDRRWWSTTPSATTLTTPDGATAAGTVPSGRPGPSLAAEVLGLPNRITLVRTVVAMAVAVAAYRVGTPVWLVLGYAVYWAGDLLDGGVARHRDEETVSGAVFDIICDRACAFFLAGAFLAAYPDVLGPLTIFLFQFGVLDTMLSLAFLLAPGCISPNYYYRVDRWIWRWNWSHVAKAMNTGAVVVALVLGHSLHVMWLPYLVACAILLVKASSLVRLVRILSGRTAAAPAA